MGVWFSVLAVAAICGVFCIADAIYAVAEALDNIAERDDGAE